MHKNINEIKKLEGPPKILKKLFSKSELEKFLNLYHDLPTTVHNKKQNVVKKRWLKNYSEELENLFFDKLKNNQFKLLYLLGSDNLEIKKNNEFIIYQGSHGDRMAQIADVILPSPAYTEQNGFFINLEGRLQKAFKATNPIGNAKEDWKIFNLIVDKIKNKNLFTNYKTLIEDSLSKIKENKNIDTLPEPQTKKINLASGNFYSEEVSIRPIDYYFSNPVARASKTMSDCRLEKIRNLENRKTG
mgnify:CR=1 FL=1